MAFSDQYNKTFCHKQKHDFRQSIILCLYKFNINLEVLKTIHFNTDKC